MIQVKVTTDARTGALIRHFKTESGGKFRVFGDWNVTTQQMYALAQYGIGLIVDRAKRGIGSNDQPMPGLKKGYAIAKTKAGKGNRRNLTFTGAMLGNISVRSVSATQARMAITSTKERVKARANEQKSPWWGWSVRDLGKLAGASSGILRENVAAVGIFGTGRRRSRPIAMIGIHGASGRLAA